MQVISLIYTFFLSLYIFFYNENLLQKQYYDFKRFILIKKQNFKINYVKIIMFCVLFSCLFIPFKKDFVDIIVKILVMLCCFCLYCKKIEDEIIKFKFTSRVKRALLSYFLFYLLFALIAFIFKINYYLIPFVYLLICYVIFIISYWLSLLFEKIVLNYYKKKAKRKLNKMKNLIVIGISGSYGKTSLKYYLKQILEVKYNVLASQKSYNTFLGLLKTINEDLKVHHEVLILEIGVDKVKGMEKFIKFFPLDIGILTCIGKQHLSTFKSIENIKNEKLKLLKSLDKDKYAIINLDDDNIKDEYLNLKCKCMCVSSNKCSDVYAENIKVKYNCTHFSLTLNNNQYCVKTSILGRHHINNILLAVAAAKVLKIEDQQILKKIRMLKNVEHRMSMLKDQLWDIIDDSYNSNVSGFMEALNVLKKSPNPKILLTPGLIETANNLNSIDKELAVKIKNSTDYVFFTNINGKNLFDELNNIHYKKQNVILFNSFKEAYQYLKNNFLDMKLTILIENDLPDIYLK